MIVKKSDKEIIIKIDAGVDVSSIQRLWEYLKSNSIASKSKATQEEVDFLANESKTNWWSAHIEKAK